MATHVAYVAFLFKLTTGQMTFKMSILSEKYHPYLHRQLTLGINIDRFDFFQKLTLIPSALAEKIVKFKTALTLKKWFCLEIVLLPCEHK